MSDCKCGGIHSPQECTCGAQEPMVAETDPATFDVNEVLARLHVIDPTIPVEMTGAFYRGLLERIARLELELADWADSSPL